MKSKGKHKNRQRKQAARSAKSAPRPAEPMTRRDMLRIGSYATAGTALMAGGGWYFVSEVQAAMHEQDLSRLGNGVPTIVQIHDPQCRQCNALQKASRRAMDGFGEDDLQFLVANIREPKGRAFANAHGVQHVTLVFFDGNGGRREIVTGVQTTAFLREAFSRHVAREEKRRDRSS